MRTKYLLISVLFAIQSCTIFCAVPSVFIKPVPTGDSDDEEGEIPAQKSMRHKLYGAFYHAAMNGITNPNLDSSERKEIITSIAALVPSIQEDLSQGADPNGTICGGTFLSFVCSKPHLWVFAKPLLEAKGDPNAAYPTIPVISVARYLVEGHEGAKDILNLLVKHGADINKGLKGNIRD